MSHKYVLEVCLASVEDALIAEQAGADRLELNQALELGGLTPPLPLVEEVLSVTSLPVLVMVRPRAGGYVYSSQEKLQMLREAELLLERGVQGIVSGALLESGEVDREFCKELRNLCTGRELVFHRAIDEMSEPIRAIDSLVDLGTTRILTSGGQSTAPTGATTIRKMVDYAHGRIEILPGAGVNSGNVLELLRLTGCTQVHGSFRWRSSENNSSSDSRILLNEVAAVRGLLDSA